MIEPYDEGINKWLIDMYGYSIEGKPKFQLTWTTGKTEKRLIDSICVNDNGLTIGHIKEVKEVLRYPFYQNRWVLEEFVYTGEIKDLPEKVGYEPLYTFQNKEGEILPLNRGVIEVFIYFHQNRSKYIGEKIARKTELDYEQIAEDKVERERIVQKLGELSSVPHLMDLV